MDESQHKTGFTPLRIVGGVLVAAGLVLAFDPTLVHDPGPAPNTFEAIERRIPWGAVLGVGAFLVARTRLKPWLVTLAAFVFWIVGGFLFARLIGIALDGADDQRQWMWVGVEAALCLVAGIYLRYRSR